MVEKDYIPFEKIAVIGLGLLGGSLSMALKKRFENVEITAFVRTPHKVKDALDDGSVDFIFSMDEMELSDFQLIVVSTPVVISLDIIKSVLLNKTLKHDAIVIDVGSVKGDIVLEVAKLKNSSQFVGCHPMAGSEKTGYRYSTVDLYENASIIITPSETNRKEDLERIKNFWDELDGKVSIVSPHEHDRAVSLTSHLPHLLSCAMVNLLEEEIKEKISIEKIRSFIGSGFSDMSRLSAGSPEMWQDISIMNRENISKSIDGMIEILQKLKRSVDTSGIKESEVYDFLIRAKNFREELV